MRNTAHISLTAILAVLFTLFALNGQAQITIGGSVYGGGNEGETVGSTTVTVRQGTIKNVYGGARMANVGGRAFVNIDGEHSGTGQILIGTIYGGNDIAGTVGTGVATNSTETDAVPTELTDVLRNGETAESHPEKNAINNSWDAFIRCSKKENANYDNSILIGTVYGGGNGDYIYSTEPNAEGEYTVSDANGNVLGTSTTSFTTPELQKTYLEINGGCLAHVYGGGNMATVTDNTVISMNNTSRGLQELLPKKGATETDADYQARLMSVVTYLSNFTGISTFQSDLSSIDYTSTRVFGGNNKAEMNIQPHWNLRNGKIRDLYSGGNLGNMTYKYGLLLEIPESTNIDVTNVFGGCRRADVHPKDDDGNDVPLNQIQLQDASYKFPAGLSARLLVRGGNIKNVYGGNDISGDVFGGTAVGIYHDISGDVYGGGNGSYAYTDNANLANDPNYGDYYYDVNSILGKSAGSTFTPLESAEALFKHRPNAERVSLRLFGTEENPTIIAGSVYVGGNSATLMNNNTSTEATGELKIGSYVMADKVFFGNNGENMVSNDVLQLYNGSVTVEGTLYDFSTMDLTVSNVFAKYMEGCASFIKPSIVFDKKNADGTGDPSTYLEYTSQFGSIFCGGNVGSMMWAGTAEMNFSHEIVVFDKVVGGCNDAFVPPGTYNAEYRGGVLGSEAEQQSGGMVDGEENIRNALVLNLSGLKIEPKRWKYKWESDGKTRQTDAAGNYIYDLDSNGNRQLEWNVYDSSTDLPVEPPTPGTLTDYVSVENDLNRRLDGGNIYGGCYNSGIVNGSVVININNTLVDRNLLFDVVAQDTLGEAILYGQTLDDILTPDKKNYNILTRNTGVILGCQGMDVLGRALNIFGGGYGERTEIWGSTTINLNAGYVFQIFGGSERGVIGKANDGETGATESVTFNGNTYTRNSKYSCTVNVCGNNAGVSKQDDSSESMAEAEFIYGGGFLGPICGNTIIRLGNGRVFNTFAGSCMADILGHTETYMGRQVTQTRNESGGYISFTEDLSEGFPYVRDYIYCGNDLGGNIFGEADFSGTDYIRPEAATIIANAQKHGSDVTTATTYVEYRQGRAEGIFGGCYGTYDYTDPYFGDFFYSTGATDLGTNTVGSARDGYTKPRLRHAFVNFRPTYDNTLLIGTKKYNFVNSVYGAGQGYPADADRDIMQHSSYVLIDIPESMPNWQSMEVFGAGAWSGVGMHTFLSNKTEAEISALSDDDKASYLASLDDVSAIIDLARGQIGAAYGGSYAEGVTRRTVVNVPEGSTISIGSIFGGAYGTDTFMPCDVYESNVEYHSATAKLIYSDDNPLHKGAIYGGNNNKRRTLYARINIDKPVTQSHSEYGNTTANVFGAGYGKDTWAEYTEVNLGNGAQVYNLYGGGEAGKVLNAETIQSYINSERPDKWAEGTYKEGKDFTKADWANAWRIGGLYDSGYDFEHEQGDPYWSNNRVNLANPLVRVAEVDDRDWSSLATEHIPMIVNKYNTNVIINEGATVKRYAYGGGLGAEAIVAGHTYIALLGGKVEQDIYAGGTSGAVEDMWEAGTYHSGSNNAGFVATTTAYVEGGTVRNVYGGGWRGDVGRHDGAISASPDTDILGESHVIIGKPVGTSYTDGVPSITRNVYGGGEGGSIFGTAYVKIYNGYIGFRYNGTLTDDATTDLDDRYVAELDNATAGDNLLDKGGNVFGGGYVANSYTDFTDVKMYGGVVRGCMFGGGEIGPIGRGTVAGMAEGESTIWKGGRTDVRMYSGHVLRDVFGGGRGYDNWNGDGTAMYSQEDIDAMDLSCKGYIFGHTQVCIRGGEIGTDDGVALGYGNVFGGGDRGFVYSADGKKLGKRFDQNKEGYYYEYRDGAFVDYSGEWKLTEDCKVLVGVQCKALGDITLTNIFYPQGAPIPPQDLAYLKANDITTGYDQYGNVTAEDGITIDSRTYKAGEYVTTYALNTLKDKSIDASKWALLDDYGVVIHNAIFAGGNISSGDDQVYANAPTVFGNATASIHDVYNRDLISVGTGHVGGLYGDGNLTLVDGYRGLNITNYGTDYFNLGDNISYEQYETLTEREKEYYEIKFECVATCKDKDGHEYSVGDKLSLADLHALFVWNDGDEHTNIFNADHTVNTTYWVQKGICSIYAGRILNTIQRADFCGVFGSRLVLQGAPDRVPETVDYTNYTINRVREVSLNKKTSVAGDTGDKAKHGNYFGIYNIVNYLGHLTSDVNIDDTRTASSTEYPVEVDATTYRNYKEKYLSKKNRNRASSHNKLALASGVYLELVTERSTGTGIYEKDWGYITGVVELDLINIQTGIGGGYVYARNVHGVRTTTGYKHTTITALNKGAVTRRDYTYSDDDEAYKTATNLLQYETSGNFVNDDHTIIDDCYDINGLYQGADRSPAHYWYIWGNVYIYDQYISSYTGTPAAYKESVNIPLTITAQSHGKLKLLDIQPNRYAYLNANGNPLGRDEQVEIGGVNYSLNQPIDYWTWSLLEPHERALFVEETYTVIERCKIGDTEYAAGDVMLKSDYEALYGTALVYDEEKGWYENSEKGISYLVRLTNNISHDNGYILTYAVNNPMKWNNWYTLKNGSATNKINTETYNAASTVQGNYHAGPTYRIKTEAEAGIYGQHTYKVTDIIDSEVYTTYQTMTASNTPSGTQATFNEAYVVTVDELETDDAAGHSLKLFKGSALAKENFSDDQWAAISGSVAKALVATTTIPVSSTEYIYTGTLVTQARKTELINAATTAGNTELETLLTNSLVDAYYCTSPGLYGGNHFAYDTNYRGLEVWSSMSQEDRSHFTFNYDALDVLIDPTYANESGQKYQYDGEGFTSADQVDTNGPQYSIEQPVDYTATYSGSAMTVTNAITVTRNGNTVTGVTTIQSGDELSRTVYESLPNEQLHYSPFTVSGPGNIYIVNTPFTEGITTYTAGQVLTASEYNSLVSGSGKVTTLTFNADQTGKYYYCNDKYTVGEHGDGRSVTNVYGTSKTYGNGEEVPVGVIIAEGTENAEGTYRHLVNKQTNFTVFGIAPVESSTFYVARNSNIYDLSQDKIITVIYQYEYAESDESGQNISQLSERHVVNIHLQFKSGIPSVSNISAPDLVLPGTNVVISTPNVTPGAYEVLGGGWEIFRNESDAESHVNGVEYSPGTDPLYWYQNGYQVAYYAKTYLGKTYSNHVELSVANYHDLKKVMDDQAHHYHIDNDDVKREPKIYINDYSGSGENGLTMLKKLFDLSVLTSSSDGVTDNTVTAPGPLNGHALMNTTEVGGLKNLEFFLRTDLSADEVENTSTGYATWTPIGTDNGDRCFDGTLHGDGHTIRGLDNSLFSHLCGEVYNLGVTGSFTSAGLADEGTGFVENCWVKSTATAASGVKAVFNDPTDTTGDNPRTVHVVNCYYPTAGGYAAQTGATAMSEQAFYNGEVTYDLNEFYLFKRYCDNTTSLSSNAYSYWHDDAGTLTKQTGYYDDIAGPYLVTDAASNYIGSYVESRFADGDFVYAGGSIPGYADKRYDSDDKKHYPIWPDDYLFFGQTLTYGHNDAREHQPLPTIIIKNGDRLPTASTTVKGNRVYRAPAYYRSAVMGVAYFNPDVILAQTKKGDASMPVHRYMTALDFTGYNDVSNGYKKKVNDGHFYQPLLDDDGIFSITNINLTKNLLVYTRATGGTGSGETPTATQQTANVVSSYLLDQPYAETNTTTYRTVAVWDKNSDNIKGHWVQGNGSDYTATLDHMLVDREDFNAPISYTFATGKRMWYQRTPDLFIDRTKGWEAISLPFQAELVTTQTKGELTHFYNTTLTDNDGINVGSAGHEYWLRQLTKGGKPSDSNANIYEASFTYPAAGTNTKDYTNTYLWDYYYQYSGSSRQDKNTDAYQQKYYASAHSYSDYPYSVAGTPYIVGFPGSTYYEFDLSGTFQPDNTLQSIEKLPKQTVTFASPTATTIDVSDTELTTGAAASTQDGYIFTPNYLGVTIAAGAYTLNAEGSSFDVTTAATTAVPFRPYFAKTAGSRLAAPQAKQIVFGNASAIDESPMEWMRNLYGGLDIYAKRGRIIVESHRETEGLVRILTTAGVTVTTFAIQPGEVVETPVHATGVYIVNNKKLRVKGR